MKNVLAVFSGLVGIFLLHLLVFFASDSYRDAFKSLKYDSYMPTSPVACDCEERVPEKEIIYETIADQYADTKNQLFSWYRTQMQKVADVFEKYGFIEEGIFASSPFALEYENPFQGFTRKDYQDQYLYFFPGISFDELLTTYRRIGEETEEYTINEVDYIAHRAFFVNTAISDDMIRLVIQKNENIFWLMMKKEYYDDIREIVQNF